MNIKSENIIFLTCLLILAALLLPTTIVHAATITVNVANDVINNTNGDCTLREAITAANNDVAEDGCLAGNGDDTIQFSAVGTITLNAELPLLRRPLTINGPGIAALGINGADTWRVFTVDSVSNSATVNISGLIISNGAASMGGRYLRLCR